MHIEITWDYEADLIVVGSGAAGLTASIEARKQGMSVIVVESQPSFGGTSIICGGGIVIPNTPMQRRQGIVDSVDAMYNDMVSMTRTDNNPENLRVYCEQSERLWDWLEGQDVEFIDEPLVGVGAQSVPRIHYVNARKMCETLYGNACEAGAVFHFGVKGLQLIQEPVTKRVLGMRAEGTDGHSVWYRAHKAVVVATGGYSRNTQLLNQHIFGEGAENIACETAPGDDGSGLVMCMEAGADTRHLGYCSLYTQQHPDGDGSVGCAMYHVGAILVNRAGRRFVNEAQGFEGVWEDVMHQPDGICFSVWDGKIAQQQRGNSFRYHSQQKLEESGLLLKADSLAELAEAMGVSSFPLVASVCKYNQDLSEYGYDTVFGRHHLVAKVGTPVAIDEPPFYAWKTRSSILTTHGGIRKDTNCQAIDVLGHPIPGLFVAGGISGFCEMGIVPGTHRSVVASGPSLGGALALGRYAAERIAALDC
ncbi:Fumarate reductase flavoprotein subunit precursor [Slackia heliotrinireducens]|uniref:FAD-dependent oxidoreductase n=1 Tax=Slackia heliotrinireducens TaxID=84110 RepID=UPI0001A373BD|nr:FAD-dependent oxidoreductase [Slackia heliotrinireducens]VEG98920.1 Fumarate reductase flavoprotein subunit precursor [Slackia heliotrinireducens]